MDAAIKRANQNQNQEASRTAMSIIRSNSAVFSMGRDTYELRDSWIVDSGADINICNERTRFLTYEPVEGEYARFGTVEVKIHGYGNVELQAIGMNQKLHILEVSRVAYIPDCHTNLLSTFQMKRHGYYLNQRLNVIEDQNGRPICRTESKHNMEVVEYSPISNIFAMNRYSERAHESAATSERWHQRLAHLGDEAVQHLEEASIGAKVLSCKRSICETCRLAKAAKQISRTPRERSTEPFESVHFDLIPLHIAHNGDRWVTHFVCESTGWHVVYTHPDKDQLNGLIKQFIQWVKTQFGLKPKKITITDERDVTFNEDILFDPDQPFHAEAIKISDLPELPVEINELPDIDDLPSLVGSADEELDEVEARGVNVAINEASEARAASNGAMPNKESGQTAESPEANIAPPTPLATPGRPIQRDEPIESIEQNDDLGASPQGAGIPGGWIDSPRRDSQQREQPIRLDLITPRSPTRINDSPEPETPIRLTDTLPESPDRLEPEDSPSKQLFEEVNRLSIEPNDRDEPDDVDDIPWKPKHSVSADFSLDNVIEGKRQRRPTQGYGFTATWMDALEQFHSVFASFGIGLKAEASKKRLHRDEIPSAPDGWREMQKHPLKELFEAAAQLEHNTLLARGTFQKVRTPRDKQIIPLRWVFTYKFDQEGYLIKAKARIC
ncbi:hypothetical protein GB937_010867, partial [Aspergillus fischeri]